MKLRDIGFSGAGFYLARQIFTFAPILVVLAILAMPERDVPSDLLQSLSRLGSFTYAFGSAALLFVLAGYAIMSINFMFYCYDSWEELNTVWKRNTPVTSPSEKRARRYRLMFALSLIGNFALLFFFWIIIALDSQLRWDLLALGRLVAVFVFLLFAIGDSALCRAQSQRREIIEGSAAAATRQRDLALLDNDVSLSGLSVFLIDMPALAVAILALISIHVMHINPGDRGGGSEAGQGRPSWVNAFYKTLKGIIRISLR